MILSITFSATSIGMAGHPRLRPSLPKPEARLAATAPPARVMSAVHHDSAADRIIVYAFLQSVKFQTGAMAAIIFAPGPEKTDRAFVGFRPVGKPCRI